MPKTITEQEEDIKTSIAEVIESRDRPYKLIMSFIWYMGLCKDVKGLGLTRKVRNSLSHTDQVLEPEVAQSFLQRACEIFASDEGLSQDKVCPVSFFDKIEATLVSFEKPLGRKEDKNWHIGFSKTRGINNVYRLYQLSKDPEACPYELLYRFVIFYEWEKAKKTPASERVRMLRNEIQHPEDPSYHKSIEDLVLEVKAFDWVHEYLKLNPPSDECYEPLWSIYNDLEGRIERLEAAFPDSAQAYRELMQERLRPFEALTALEKMEMMEYPDSIQLKIENYKGLKTELESRFEQNAEVAFSQSLLSDQDIKSWYTLGFSAIEVLKAPVEKKDRVLEEKDFFALRNAMRLLLYLDQKKMGSLKVIEWILGGLSSMRLDDLKADVLLKLSKTFKNGLPKKNLLSHWNKNKAMFEYTDSDSDIDPIHRYLKMPSAVYLMLAMSQGWGADERFEVARVISSYANAMYGKVDFRLLAAKVAEYVDFPKTVFFQYCFIAMIGCDLHKDREDPEVKFNLKLAECFVREYLEELSFTTMPRSEIYKKLKHSNGVLSELISLVDYNIFSEENKVLFINILNLLSEYEDRVGIKEGYHTDIVIVKGFKKNTQYRLPTHLMWMLHSFWLEEAPEFDDLTDQHKFELKMNARMHHQAIKTCLSNPAQAKSYLTVSVEKGFLLLIQKRLSEELKLRSELPCRYKCHRIYALPLFVRTILVSSGVDERLTQESIYEALLAGKFLTESYATVKRYLVMIRLYMQHGLEIDRLVKANRDSLEVFYSELGLLLYLFALEWSVTQHSHIYPLNLETAVNMYKRFVVFSSVRHGVMLKLDQLKSNIKSALNALFQKGAPLAPEFSESLKSMPLMIKARWEILGRVRPRCLGKIADPFCSLAHKVKPEELLTFSEDYEKDGLYQVVCHTELYLGI